MRGQTRGVLGAALCAGLLTMVACEDDGDAVVSMMSETVGTDGGEVASGGASADLPAGAVSEDVEISIGPAPDGIADLPEGAEFLGDPISFLPHGIQFDAPVTITVPYSGTPEEGKEPLLIYLEDDDDDSWEPVDGEPTFADGVATYETSHFSIYAVAAEVGEGVQDDGSDDDDHDGGTHDDHDDGNGGGGDDTPGNNGGGGGGEAETLNLEVTAHFAVSSEDVPQVGDMVTITIGGDGSISGDIEIAASARLEGMDQWIEGNNGKALYITRDEAGNVTLVQYFHAMGLDGEIHMKLPSDYDSLEEVADSYTLEITNAPAPPAVDEANYAVGDTISITVAADGAVSGDLEWPADRYNGGGAATGSFQWSDPVSTTMPMFSLHMQFNLFTGQLDVGQLTIMRGALNRDVYDVALQ